MGIEDKNDSSMNRIQLCKAAFLLKALLAIILGSLALLYQAKLVMDMYYILPPPLPPVEFPLIGSVGAERCFYDAAASGRARLEPPDGSFFFGFSPLWTTDGNLPSDIARSLENRVAIYNSFVGVNNTDYRPEIIEWNCQIVGKLGGVLELTLQPLVKPDTLTDEFFNSFALHMRKMNSVYGVPILLRFMHEMNGPWMEYGLQPTAQIAAWRKLTNAIRAQTNMTAMVWSPNLARGYPFLGSGYDLRIPTASSADPAVLADFRLLNTNGDGVISAADDPYLPYYPGDEFVDWIGISVYNYARGPGGGSVLAQQDAFSSPQSDISLFAPNFPYYKTFVEAKGKPFMFSETGSAVDKNIAGSRAVVTTPNTPAEEAAIKQSWWRAIFEASVNTSTTTVGKTPQLKAAVWFEENKNEESYQDSTVRVIRDYRVTFQPEVRDSFLADIKSLGNSITSPGKFQFTCDGRFNILQ